MFFQVVLIAICAILHPDAHSKKTFEETQSFGTSLLVRDQKRLAKRTTQYIDLDQEDAQCASLQGSCVSVEVEDVSQICYHNGAITTRLEMHTMQDYEQKAGGILPEMWWPLGYLRGSVSRPRHQSTWLGMGKASTLPTRQKLFETEIEFGEKKEEQRQGQGRKRDRSTQRRSAIKQVPVLLANCTTPMDWGKRWHHCFVDRQCYAESPFRGLASFEEDVPRPFPDAGRTTVSSGENRSAEQQADDAGSSLSYVTTGKGEASSCGGQRSEDPAQEGMVCLSHGVCGNLARATEELRGTGATSSSTRGEVTLGNHPGHGPHPTIDKQKCSGKWASPSDSTCRTCGCRRCCRGEEAKGADPQSSCSLSLNSQNGGRGDSGGFRHRGPIQEKAKIRRAWKWAWAIAANFWCCSQPVKVGSAVECLRNHLREPKQVRFNGTVEAYHHVGGAASRALETATLCSYDPAQPWLHSVRMETDYLNPYLASLRALQQRFQVSLVDEETDFVGLAADLPKEIFLQNRLTDQRQEDMEAISSSPADDAAAGHEVLQEEPMLIIDDWEQLRAIISANFELTGDEISLTMYGLFQRSVGTRYATSQPDLHSIRASVFEAWNDFLIRDTTAFLHLVCPQEHLERREIHFVIEFSNLVVPLPRGDLPVLRRLTWHFADAVVDTVAAYHTPNLHPPRLLIQCGLSEWCGPELRTTCNLHVEKRVMIPLSPVPLQSGSLVEIFVHLGDVETEEVSMIQTQFKPAVVQSSGQKDNSASGTSGPLLTCFRPNHEIQVPFDEVLPQTRMTPTGPILVGRIIPPPQWNTLPIFRAASSSGALFRGGDGHLIVRIRSWYINHEGPFVGTPRDFAMRPQLLVRLHEALRRTWQDLLPGRETITIRAVRPSPGQADEDGVRRFHVLAEIQRPVRTNQEPILISLSEISSEGVARPVWCPTLLPTRFTTQDILNTCGFVIPIFQLLTPLGGAIRRWMSPYHERVATPGLYLPCWHDRRLRPLSREPYEVEEEEEGDATNLMQRSASRSPRRDLITPSTTGSSMSALLAHIFHMTAEHRLIVFDRTAPLSFFNQLSDIWRHPPHVHAVALHEVLSPPSDLASNADSTFILELSIDSNRRATPTDVLILLDIVIADFDDTGDPTHLRRVVWSRHLMSRLGILYLASSSAFCDLPEVLCEVQINGQIWSEDDQAQRQVLHGDFVNLRISGPREMSTSDIQVVLCEQEAADIQRHLFRESPSRSSTPQDSEGETSGSTHSRVDSPTQPSQPSLLSETLPGVHVSWEPVARPHVSDLWCADQPGPQDPCPPSIDVCFAKVIRNFEWLDNHFVLPCFVIPSDFPLTLPSLQWTQLPWWDFQEEAEEIQIYVDGSSESSGSGAGIAAFVRTKQLWYFAGVFSSKLGAIDSYRAELSAAIFGLKVAHDFCKLVLLNQTYQPWITIKYDALTVGNQLLGNWACHQAPVEAKVLRSIVSLLQFRFDVRILGQHVRGHSGEPGNELVDVLAGQASKGFELSNFQSFLDFVCNEEFAASADWFWMLFRQDLLWRGQEVSFPATPTTTPDEECIPSKAPANCEVCKYQISIRLATINVLTLRGTKANATEDTIGIGGPTRKEIVLRQLADAEVSIFALQETRITTKIHHTEDFWLFGSSANARGHYGMMVGFSRRLPIGEGPNGPVTFLEKDFSVIEMAPRLLILRLKSQCVKAIIIAAHAPHTGASLDDITSYWKGVSTKIPDKYVDWPRVLLADANVRLGTVTSLHVGPHQAEVDTEKSEPFCCFLAEEALWLPSTFSDFQVGPGATWKGISRNDFIGLSQQWDFHHCRAWVDTSVDVSTLAEDHAAAMLDFQFTTFEHYARRDGGHHAIKPFDEEAVLAQCGGWDSRFSDYLCRLPPTGWHVDVHTHAHWLQQNITSFLHRAVKRPRRPLRQVMSDETWKLVQSKREARTHVAECRQLQRQLLLTACFAGWRALDSDDGFPCFASSQKSVDIQMATALFEFRTLGRLVTAAIRKDDRAFFSQLAREGAETYEHGSAKRFWNVIRRSLPKFRQRRLSMAPMKLENLEGQWEDYFQDLEVGHPTTNETLVRSCSSHQASKQSMGEVCGITLQDLPSLFEIEREFRATTAYRSTGLDPVPSGLFRSCAASMALAHFDVIFKQFLWQSEPVQSKGGPLVVIPKRLQAHETSHFRGIMLLPTMAKRVHALLRKRIMSLLVPLRPGGQLGGFPRQQVGFGSQPLHIFGKLADCQGYTSGVLFVDLANAFHRLVRELVTGLVIPDDAAAVVANLQHHGRSTAGLCRWMELPGLLERLKAPPLLIKLMQDIHCFTWYQLEVSDGPTVTRRGTRPGSPLADCVFHVLMLDIIVELNEWIRQQSDYAELLGEMEIQIDTVVWSDDLAIPWCSRQASDIIPALLQLLRKVYTCFDRRGFQLNLAKQKTSAVISFRGPGSKSLRETYYLKPHGGIPCRFSDGSDGLLHVVPMYKHLGTYFTEKHDLEAEIGVRIGMAWSAFQSISKPILSNRHLPLKVRSQLFQALILTKLFFGCGTWHTPTLGQCRKLRSVLWRMCQRILGRRDRFDGMTMEEIFAKLKILDPRVYIAQERLRFAQAMFSEGPAFARQIILRERQLSSNSWLEGLDADLSWLRNVGAFPEHPDLHDLEAAIQWWQSPHLCNKAHWKTILTTTLRRHHQQEATIQETHGLQREILRALSGKGAKFSPDPRESVRREANFECACGRWFTTGQGLASHRRLAHGIKSLEFDLLDGATCPCCMRYFWTTQRLQQHLAYISRRTGVNSCYNWLRERGYTAAQEAETFVYPTVKRSLQRLHALPTLGPGLHMATHEEKRREALEQELFDKLQQLDLPDPSPDLRVRQYEAFDACILQWFSDFNDAGCSTAGLKPLGDRFLECFEDGPLQLQWSEQIFLDWTVARCGQHVDAFEDGEAEWLVEEEVAQLLAELPRHTLHSRVQVLRRSIEAVDQGLAAQQDRGHRPIRRGVANRRERVQTQHEIRVAYEDQPAWQSALEEAVWQSLPNRGGLPMLRSLSPRPHFLVVHLFSGRRRPGDIHFHLNQWAQTNNLVITILSLDTAVSSCYGNLCVESSSWRRVLELFNSGWVSGAIAGSPCETYSAARHQRPEPRTDGTIPRWPRPLRSALRPFGLAGLSAKEYRQLKQGSAFFVQTTLLAALQLVNGGIFLSEHPAPPHQEAYASIWRTGIMKLILRHPLAKLHILQQWRWGAEARKPTGVLAIGMPTFATEMYRHCDPGATCPAEGAIGKGPNGEFKTAKLKEYPFFFSKGLAYALGAQMYRQYVTGSCVQFELPSDLVDWVHEAAIESHLVTSRTFLPDYQGR